jgi:hypothetical protein
METGSRPGMMGPNTRECHAVSERTFQCATKPANVMSPSVIKVISRNPVIDVIDVKSMLSRDLPVSLANCCLLEQSKSEHSLTVTKS